MNCPNCGAQVAASEVFCPNCGNRLRGGMDAVPEQPGTAETTPPTSPEGSMTSEMVFRPSSEPSPEGSSYSASGESAGSASSDGGATGDSTEPLPSYTDEPAPSGETYQSPPSYSSEVGGSRSSSDQYQAAPSYQSPPSYESPPTYEQSTRDSAGQSGSPFNQPPTAPQYPSQQYGAPGQPPGVQQPKDSNLAFILEVLPGLFGFLGIGHMYAGNVGLGVAALIGWWVFLTVEIFLFFVLIGFCLLPLNVIVPVLSGFWVKSQIEGRPFSLKW